MVEIAKKKVLIIDDEEELANSLGVRLKCFVARTVKNGEIMSLMLDSMISNSANCLPPGIFVFSRSRYGRMFFFTFETTLSSSSVLSSSLFFSKTFNAILASCKLFLSASNASFNFLVTFKSVYMVTF